MSDQLKQLAFNQDKRTNMVSEDHMLQGIREMAVTTLHPAVHSLALHEIKQKPDETMKVSYKHLLMKKKNITLIL